MINKVASAIYNNVTSGLIGITSTPTISMSQLEDDSVLEFLQIVKEYSLKNLIPRRDLFTAINSIEVDCKALDRFPACSTPSYLGKPELHFEIPQIVNDFSEEAIEYVGSTDKNYQYKVYLDTSWQYHKYLRRGSEKAFVYIECTPNENNMYDGWIFNAPFVKNISIIAIFKDPRQVESFGCCSTEDGDGNLSFVWTEVIKRVTEKYLRYYKMLYAPVTSNTQQPK